MSWGLYYFVHSICNTIKKLFRSWVAILFVIFAVMMIAGGVIGYIIGNAIDHNLEDAEPNTSVSDVVEDADDEENEPMPYEMKMNILDLASSGIVIGLVLLGIYGSKTAGQGLFQMADVNLLFSAPIRPQSLMLFRVISQMGMMIFCSIYLVFQIPNLVMNVGISMGTAFMMLGVWCLTMITQNLFSIGGYTLGADHPRFRKMIVPFVVAVLAVLAGWYGYHYLQSPDHDYLQSAFDAFTPHWTRWIPVIGWLKGMVMYAAEGNVASCAVCSGLSLLSIVVMVMMVWRIKADFYEDAMNGAEKRQELLAQAAESKRGFSVQTTEYKEKREKKQAEMNLNRGAGAQMFLVHPLYHRRRWAWMHLVTKTTVLYLFLMCFTILLKVLNADLTSTVVMIIFGALILFAMLYRNMGNPIQQETDGVFFYLVPEKTLKKLTYSILAGAANTALDLLPAIVIMGFVVAPQSAVMIGWYVLFICCDFFLSSTGLLTTVLLPNNIPEQIHSALLVLMRMVLAIPIIVVLALAFGFGGSLVGFLISSAVLLGIGVGTLALASIRIDYGK